MLKIITPVSTEPITLHEVRQHLRLPETDAEDALLLSLIKTARSYCEHYTRRALAGQTLEFYPNLFHDADPIELPCPPLQRVIEISYKDKTGDETFLPPSSYLVDTSSEPGRIMPAAGKSWPAFTPYPSLPIRIRFFSGYDNLPFSIRLAILLLVGHWYENREATGNTNSLIDFSVHSLLAPYRLEVF